MARPDKVRLGELLQQQKLVSQEQLNSALEIGKRTGRRLGRILVENGYVTEQDICEALGRQLRIPYINLKHFNVMPMVARKLPETHSRRFRAIILEDREKSYLVGMADPTDLFAFDELSRLLKRDIDLAVVNEGLLVETVDRIYRRTEQITDLARELGEDLGDVIDFGTLSAGVGIEEAPVVRLLQTVFEDAVQVRASDIHVEPLEDKLRIRFRVDGQLQLETEADSKIGSAMALRLKLMSGLDIAEKRLPQDGRFNVRVRAMHIDVRISTMPTQYGESVAMRLLNRSDGVQRLEGIGMPAAMLARFREIISRSSGMVLVTGPTGSGKTTTLYAALEEINTVDKKIITVEDPVEYRMAGINQVQINEKIDLTFSRVLRSTLRQDPDIILVGEMRDAETAQIGLRAAITGHMVLSTLHTRDASSTPIRLLDMGAPYYMVATSLQAVIAQRLVRLVCESCTKPAEPTPHELEWLGDAPGGRPLQLRQGAGCPRCNGTGYSGRTGVYEMLEMDDELVAAVNRNDAPGFLIAAEKRVAGHTMRDHAITLVLSGRTTVAEAMRVTAQLED